FHASFIPFSSDSSDMMSLDRRLPDARREECLDVKYDLENLPQASVIIIFTDEAWSPLMRTVHSVVNRSPPQLLKEVILLDDNSQRGTWFLLSWCMAECVSVRAYLTTATALN
ncbi:hypothetical protein GCK32_022248, partial [Trichostrongylus colubriformis]